MLRDYWQHPSCIVIEEDKEGLPPGTAPPLTWADIVCISNAVSLKDRNKYLLVMGQIDQSTPTTDRLDTKTHSTLV